MHEMYIKTCTNGYLDFWDSCRLMLLVLGWCIGVWLCDVTQVEDELNRKLEAALSERSTATTKLEETRSLLKELESKYKKDTANLAEKARYT